jgi:simple sugar transport system permease protein
VNALSLLLFVAATLRITVPYAFAAAGASVGERGGVICLGIEGFMLNSALAYVLGAWYLHDPWLALLCAVLAGMATAALHALVSVTFRADQITSGIGINLLAAGLTRFVLVTVFHSSSNSPRVAGLPELPLGPLADIPALGTLLETPLVLLALLLVPVAAWLVFRTPYGLRLRATGELPAASAALGLSVGRLRASGVLICGAFSGLAGAWLASGALLTDNMTGGCGHRDRRDDQGRVRPAPRGVPAVRRHRGRPRSLQWSGSPSALLQRLCRGR